MCGLREPRDHSVIGVVGEDHISRLQLSMNCQAGVSTCQSSARETFVAAEQEQHSSTETDEERDTTNENDEHMNLCSGHRGAPCSLRSEHRVDLPQGVSPGFFQGEVRAPAAVMRPAPAPTQDAAPLRQSKETKTTR